MILVFVMLHLAVVQGKLKHTSASWKVFEIVY